MIIVVLNIPTKGLWLPDVSTVSLPSTTAFLNTFYSRFLHADPTPSALQVFLRQPGAISTDTTGLPMEQGDEQGAWINADPIPGCVVCNIGESENIEMPTCIY